MTTPLTADPPAARTGVWAIRPQLALRWGARSPTLSVEQVGSPATIMIRAVGVLGAVAVAGTLGGVGAWVLSA